MKIVPMFARLRGDWVETPIEEFTTEPGDDFGVDIDVLLVGEPASRWTDLSQAPPGVPVQIGDLFSVTVRPPQEPGFPDEGMAWAWQAIVTRRFEWESVQAFIRETVDQFEADTWPDLAKRLEPHLHWVDEPV